MKKKNIDKSLLEIVYESAMFVLAFIAVATIWYQTQHDSLIVWGTWVIFFVDFLYRFINTKRKWQFIRSNPFMVIAIVPLDAIFQLARIARLLHFMRLKVITKYYAEPIIEKLEKQRVILLVPISFLVIFISVVPLYLLEPKLQTYYDAFIGGMASIVFFGYTKISPVTTTGTVIITMLTILGVIIHGLIIRFLLLTFLDLQFVKSVRKKWGKQRSHHDA
ncbi:hypothetical protein ACERII_04850 [Evansella sp. AB-rgal1]|uniref:hypothetical protein n=1 Tax=Evansella sp. AB-rgal1 TaxID=3242696 RepID=UPI00359EF3A2